MKVLLLSAYAAQSHVHWQRSLQAMFPAWQWQLLSLPPRHFSWRVRGNPLYWALAERPLLEQDYDLLVATSMVDLATLRGLVPALSRLPSIVYFHENQFDYPQHRQQHSLLEAQMVSLYSALAADRLVFNSGYNLRSFLKGCQALLQRLPDRVPPGIVAGFEASSQVLPVALKLQSADAVQPLWPAGAGTMRDYLDRPLRLLWAGRFEHDKGGDRLLLLLDELERSGLDYQLAVVGQQFRNSPAVFGQIEQQFSHRLVQFGYVVDPRDYRALLGAADLVVSTATHEFQGLAVLEAVASGALPVVPDRLAYPEIYPGHHCYPSDLPDAAAEARSAAALVQRLARQLAQGAACVPDVSAFGQEQLRPAYSELFAAVAGLAP
jgi:glycosyltransferase involved in cell wall biosynthesis